MNKRTQSSNPASEARRIAKLCGQVSNNTYKITTKVSILNTDLYFPSISFCDLNPLSLGKIIENKDKVNLAKHLMAVIKKNHDAIEGLKNGTIDIRNSDYIPYVADDPGVVLSIHENGHRPFLQSNGFAVSPGFKTDISIEQKRKERIRDACFEVCKETIVEKNCNCSPSLSDIHLGLGLCENITELQCMEEAEKRSDSCGCKEPCSEVQYKTFRSFTIWPGRSYVGVLDALLKERGLTYQDLRDSLLFINIYFTSLQEEITEEELAYTVENFWSDIGGSLGLWVGMSVISLAEILELGILILRFLRKRTFRLFTTEKKRANAEATLNDGLNQIIKGFYDINEDKQGGRIEFNDGLNKIINSINILAAEQQKIDNDQNSIEISIIANERVQPEQHNIYSSNEFVLES
ncbi:unnamed protein product [Mytilus coruscus]|uniref:SCNN1B n=1 Tax=Mytilus coruscus TaxID=42192 RepID=A0A6J8EH66_MYTCO|nr:unnamed protein product [Mytilus coruscus]